MPKSTYAGAPEITGGQSPNIWGSCPEDEILKNPMLGFVFTRQFASNADALVMTDVIEKMYSYWGATSGGSATVPVGRDSKIALITGAASGDFIFACLGNGVHGPIEFAAGRKIWLEARIGMPSVADINAYVGLAGPSAIAVGGMLDSAAASLVASEAHVGFTVRNGATIQVVHAVSDATNDYVVDSDVGTITAAANIEDDADFVNVGFYWDGTTVHFYVDNTEVTTVLSSATGFPAATTELTPVIGVQNSTAAAKTMWVQFIKVAYLKA